METEITLNGRTYPIEITLEEPYVYANGTRKYATDVKITHDIVDFKFNEQSYCTIKSIVNYKCNSLEVYDDNDNTALYSVEDTSTWLFYIDNRFILEALEHNSTEATIYESIIVNQHIDNCEFVKGSKNITKKIVEEFLQDEDGYYDNDTIIIHIYRI